MVFAAVMGFQALGGQLTGRDAEGMSAAALYWYVTIAVYTVDLVRASTSPSSPPPTHESRLLRCSPPDPSGSSAWGSSPWSSRPPTAGPPAAPASARSPSGTTAASVTTSATPCSLSIAVVATFLGLITVAIRDADPRRWPSWPAPRRRPAAVPPAHLAYWPVLGAFGVSMVVLGLVISNVLFIAGFILLLAVLVEWMVLAWSDRATGDPETNRLVRNRLMGPYEVPLAGVLIAGWHRRRLLPAVPHRLRARRRRGGRGGRRSWCSSSAPLIATRPKLSANVVAGLPRGRGRRVVTAGVVSAARGERDDGAHEVHEVAPTGCRGRRCDARGAEHRRLHAQHPGRHAPRHHARPRRQRVDPPTARPRRLGRAPSRSARSSCRCCSMSACAKKAPLDTLNPKGSQARTIDHLVNPVFIIAGVVFVLVQGGVLFLAVAVPQAQGRRRLACPPDPRQHQARARLDDPPRPAPRRRGRGVGAHDPRPDREARTTRSRSPSSASSGGGSTATTSTTTARTTSSRPTTW